MRKILALSGVVLTSLLISGSAFAQGAAAPPAGGTVEPAPAASGGGDDDKKIGLGLDVQFLLPVGDLADGTGPLVGPVLRFGYRVMPPLELTLRAGYLFGLGKDQGGGVSTSFSDIPIWVGGRYFVMEPHAGLYAAAEIGANILKPHISPDPPSSPLTDEILKSRTRFGFNIGAGYVISKDLPIDIRAQFSYLNLLGTESGEKSSFGVGLSVGYTLQF
jgi:hypothetical protein